jgi:ankyrin repeat protein
MLKCLLEADPAAAALKSILNGDTILHDLCRSERSDRLPLIRLCLSKAPSLVSIKNQTGHLPLHVLATCSAKNAATLEVVQLLLGAYKEAASVTSNTDGLLPLHRAAQNLDLSSIKCIFEAYPLAISRYTISSHGPPLRWASKRRDAEGLEVVQYLYEKAPEMASLQIGDDGSLPAHHAAAFGSIDILKYLLQMYPAAASTRCEREDQLPLHYHFHDRNPKECDLDKIRVLLGYNPSAASAVDEDGRSPYSMAKTRGSPDTVIRLLLLADPSIDPEELQDLNYAERRMAMFLAFTAIPRSASDSFAIRLRRLKDHGDSMPLLRLVVSFL